MEQGERIVNDEEEEQGWGVGDFRIGLILLSGLLAELSPSGKLSLKETYKH